MRSNRIWKGADLVMEVVSGDPKDRHRDYAATQIAEYWIVDPELRTVIVHHLDGDRFTVAGQYGMGQQAVSPLLPGLAIDVTALFAVIDQVAE